MFQKVMQLFINCSNEFVEVEKDLILSGVSERCLCGAFMTILRRALDNSEFANYYSDIEYNRNFDGHIKTMIDNTGMVTDITCDLIVHSRGKNPNPNLDNLIAIEMKRDTHTEEAKNSDRIRLMALTKDKNDTSTYSADGKVFPQHVCGYIVGVFYEISTSKSQLKIEYYRNGELYKNFARNF